MNTLVDTRWIGAHGVGRVASEIFRRLKDAEALQTRLSLLHPADPLWLSWQLSRLKPSVYFSPGFNPPLKCPVPLVFTVHDLIHLKFESRSDKLKKAYYAHIARPAAARAHMVLTDSEYVRGEICEWANIPIARTRVISLGAGEEFNPTGVSHDPGFPYLLYVGNRKQHKNLPRLLEAFSKSNASSDLRLLLSGAEDPALAQLIDEHRLTDKVLFAGRISDEELPAYYRGAAALLLPSLYEGFGLPALEAMASGTPVITSKVTAIPEVVGDAGIYVDPLSIDSIASGIDEIFGNAELARQLRIKGPERAKGFSWDAGAAQVQEVLDDAAGKRSPFRRDVSLERVSVVVPNLDGIDLLSDCFGPLFQEGRPSGVEVILIDNGSRDDSLQLVANSYRDVKVLANATNLGFATACNQGAALAESDFLLFLNTDVVLAPDCLVQMLETAAESGAGIVQPVLYTPEGSIDSSGHLFTWWGFLWHQRENDSGKWAFTFAAKGACMLVRRDVFELLGGFNESYFAYFEETDLCWRARMQGIEVAVSLEARATHLGGATTRRFLKPEEIHYLTYRNRLRTLLANLSPSVALRVLPAHVLACFAAAGFSLLRGQVRVAFSIFKALVWPAINWRTIFRQRSLSQGTRRSDDREVLAPSLTSWPSPRDSALLLAANIRRYDRPADS